MKFTTSIVMTALIGCTTVAALPLELVYRAHHREARNAAPSPYADAYSAPEVPQVYPVLDENSADDFKNSNDAVYQFSPPPPPPPQPAITRRSARRVRARATAAAVAQLIEEELEERAALEERDAWADPEAEEELEDYEQDELDAADEIVAAYEGGRIAKRLKREAERQEKRDEYIRSFRFHRRAADLDESY
ncbi:hypothetical protein DFH27DRAFT_615422 [Peziza echinospora]|nr:hypothetical protein DFH27DRAFT_615422 [Peziza echinospora]